MKAEKCSDYVPKTDNAISNGKQSQWNYQHLKFNQSGNQTKKKRTDSGPMNAIVAKIIRRGNRVYFLP